MAQEKKRGANTMLRILRQERGWSLQRVADELHMLAQAEDVNHMPGVNANMVGVWERGIKKPAPYYQALFCTLYNRTASQLGFVSNQEHIPSPSQEQELSASSKHITQAPHLASDHARTQAIDLLCSTTPTTTEQQVNAWLMLGASGLSQLFNEGWTLDSILESLQTVLQNAQAMTPISRRQFLQVGISAAMGRAILPTHTPTSCSEQTEIEQAFGASIAVGWKLFLTTSPAYVLAFGQAQLHLLQQIQAYLSPQASAVLYSSIYNLIGTTLHLQNSDKESLLAHQSAYETALSAGNPWYIAQSLVCKVNAYQALGQHDMSIQAVEEAVRLIKHPTNEAQLRSKAHFLAYWAEIAASIGNLKLAQEKLESSAALLDHIVPNEEFDQAHWYQYAGNCAFANQNYDTMIDYLEKALAELPASWLIRRIPALISLATAYSRRNDIEASLAVAEKALPTVITLNATNINTWFSDYLQGLSAICPHYPQVHTFVTGVREQYPFLRNANSL